MHVSITHPSLDAPDPYFRGKAEVEQALAACGVPSYAIARQAVLFGGNGVLLNNIAWLLRRLPVFAIGGRGEYRLRPIHVDDLAALCTGLGARTDTVTVDAVGPESLTFRQLVGHHSRCCRQPVSPGAGARAADTAAGPRPERRAAGHAADGRRVCLDGGGPG